MIDIKTRKVEQCKGQRTCSMEGQIATFKAESE